jgi:general secretion pathway protein A
MYEAFWGLNEPPFSLTPDPRFLFMSKQHMDALMMLHYAITRNKGAAMLSGDIGLGKTTLSRKLLESLDPVHTKIVLIVNPILTPTQFFQEILQQLGEATTSKNRQFLISELHRILIGFYERGQKVVLMVDEAHLIRASQTFEDLRLLLNCQMNDGFLISLILLGQLELRAKIQKVPALDQRIAVRQHLGPLNVPDTAEMLLHRLRVAGFSGDTSPFTADAVVLLHKYSGGIPRLATQLADNVMMVAFAQKQRVIDGFMMYSVVCDHAGREVNLQEAA